MNKQPFRLTALQVQWIIVVSFLSVGYALYLRYLAIEHAPTALTCDGAGVIAQTWLCQSRKVATFLFQDSWFGRIALLIAALHLLRPSIVLLTLGITVAGLGIVLYNVNLSGIAAGLLVLGFARPAPATA